VSEHGGPIAPALLAWYDRHGRHDLPWKAGADPYRIWLSEIMLQQTRVQTVLPYFERFVTAFPDVAALAAADEDHVLGLWTGLGYYARARNLHRAAREIVDTHAGRFPSDVEALAALPGIGRSTAGAVASMAFGVRAPILDGNVKRVLTRVAGIEGWPGERAIEKRLWALAETWTPTERIADYTQAIMDLGATVCTPRRPACDRCPLADRCVARAEGRAEVIPAARPKRTLPERETRMLLLQDPRGRVLLARRPSPGIWGGLWCFPELDVAADPVDAVATMLGLPAEGVPPLGAWGAVRHTFTHYRLTITPLHGVLSRVVDQVREEGRDWFAPAETGHVGLAAPVKRLLTVLSGDDLASTGSARTTQEPRP
jgi:A/G-specific adenine glycosylase